MYFNKDKVIAETIHFNVEKLIAEQSTPFNIAYGIDKHFLFGCAISISSILLHNQNIPFHFHIFTDYIDNDFKLKTEQLCKQYNTSITIYRVDCEELKNLPNTKNWSYATYFRFIIADVLYPQIQKLLYIDADIICKGSLQELVILNIDNVMSAAVLEKESTWWQKCAERLDMPILKNGYFNAGFLYINIQKWQEYDVSTTAMTLLSQEDVRKKLSFLDQDLLNMIFAGNVLFLDKRYNRQYSINYELKAPKGSFYKNPIDSETILIHYIGPTKPWHEWAYNYPCSSYFMEAKQHSPWKNDSLLGAKNAGQLRYCAKHQFHQSKVVAGIISYLKYYLKKITD